MEGMKCDVCGVVGKGPDDVVWFRRQWLCRDHLIPEEDRETIAYYALRVPFGGREDPYAKTDPLPENVEQLRAQLDKVNSRYRHKRVAKAV